MGGMYFLSNIMPLCLRGVIIILLIGIYSEYAGANDGLGGTFVGLACNFEIIFL